MHHQKLQQIHDKQFEYSKAKAVPLVSESKLFEKQKKKVQNDKQKALQFVASERNSAINKDNQILLSKLVEISSGKFCSVPRHPPTSSHGLSQSRISGGQSSIQPSQVSLTRNKSNASVALGNSQVNMVRSLNIGWRKKEIERIEAENQAFAKRLFNKQAEIDNATLSEEYKAHLRFKKQIQKVVEQEPNHH